MLGYFKSVRNAFYDRRLGICTTGESRPADISQHQDAKKYTSMDYGLIARYIGLLRLQRSDVVYDIGCGTGRPLCLFARQRVAQCVGVELDRGIAEIARRNVTNLIGRQAEVSVINGDAALVDYHNSTVFWLFNPFGPGTLAAVLERIRQSVEASPRSVRFCYVVPEEEQVFSECGWLTKYRTARYLLHWHGRASFWRN
jgi:precorrin-6B methylase 2